MQAEWDSRTSDRKEEILSLIISHIRNLAAQRAIVFISDRDELTEKSQLQLMSDRRKNSKINMIGYCYTLDLQQYCLWAAGNAVERRAQTCIVPCFSCKHHGRNNRVLTLRLARAPSGRLADTERHGEWGWKSIISGKMPEKGDRDVRMVSQKSRELSAIGENSPQQMHPPPTPRHHVNYRNWFTLYDWEDCMWTLHCTCRAEPVVLT